MSRDTKVAVRALASWVVIVAVLVVALGPVGARVLIALCLLIAATTQVLVHHTRFLHWLDPKDE